jgi:methionyl-tRNA formyltransferase
VAALRVAFAGTPEFARQALAAIHAAGHTVPLVLTQPDRPAGRGLKLQPSAVKRFALDAGLPLAQPRSLRLDGRYPEEAAEARSALRAASPDVLVVAAYGLILPAWVLALPRRGCVNIHGSLLPRWRGAAPIQRAIEAGDAETGITLMQMDEGLDTGAMLAAERLPIGADDTTATLHDRLAALGAAMTVELLARLAALPPGRVLPATPQPAEGVSYAAKIDKAEALIDWRQPATLIERRLRAFDPAPGCSGAVDGSLLKLWRGQVVPWPGGPAAAPGSRAPLADRLVIACGEDALELLSVQPPGARRQSAAEYLRGRGVAV